MDWPRPPYLTEKIHLLIRFFMASLIGPKIFASPLAEKHIATVLVTHVLVKCGEYWQILERLVTDITG